MNIPKRVLFFLLTAWCTILLCENSPAQNKNHSETFIVVIDPGHGGEKPGAVRGSLKEKDLNLSIALKFGKLVESTRPDVKVIYTRTKDVNIGLAERGKIANKANADLFISIHINAVDKSAPCGTSTWVMGMDKNEDNLREAMRENEVIKYEDNYSEIYEGFDPSSAESYIIFNLMQYAHFDRSLQFAKIVQKHYSKNTPMKDRGAAQGPFLVLWKTAMPSVLTEIGFISNEADRKYISSEKGQNEIAKALNDALGEFKDAIQKKNENGAESAATAPVQPAAQKDDPKPAPTGKISSGVGFYVQLCASRAKIANNDSRFGQYRGKVIEKKTDGWYKYYIGSYDSLEDAVTVRDEVKRGAFKDAFVIALDGDKQITVDEARKRIAGGK